MKRVRLLDAAAQDLKEGFDFYEQQESGLGGYFLDSLFSDIDSLLIHAGVHPTYSLQPVGQSGTEAKIWMFETRF